MKTIAKFALAALLAGSAAVAVSAPAKADVGFSIGFGGPSYYGYDYYRPCSYYFRRDLPAPRRCYDEYNSYYGGSPYISGDFLFRNRNSYYGHWRDRDDYRHWRGHDWNERGHNGGWRDHGNNDRYGSGRDGRDNGGHDWNGDRNNRDRADHHDRGDRHDRGDNGGRDHNGQVHDQDRGNH